MKSDDYQDRMMRPGQVPNETSGQKGGGRWQPAFR